MTDVVAEKRRGRNESQLLSPTEYKGYDADPKITTETVLLLRPPCCLFAVIGGVMPDASSDALQVNNIQHPAMALFANSLAATAPPSLT